MAIIMQNPDNVPGAVSTGYQLQNELLYAGNTGFCNVNFNLYDTNFGAYIYGGSIFEMNGKLIKLTIHEYISGINTIPYNSYFYIYAKMNGTSVSFYASTNPPTWDIGKCGFYYANDKALTKMAVTENGNYVQVNFDTSIKNSYLIMPKNTDSKKLVKEISGETGAVQRFITLNDGWYYIKVSGAGGGGFYSSVNGVKETAIIGGSGGLIERKIFIPYLVELVIEVGKGGQSMPAYVDSGTTAGSNSVLKIPVIGIFFIAYGGGASKRVSDSFIYGGDGGNNIDNDTFGDDTTKTGGGGQGGYTSNDFVAEPGRITIYKFS